MRATIFFDQHFEGEEWENEALCQTATGHFVHVDNVNWNFDVQSKGGKGRMRTASVFIELSSLGGTVPRSVSLVSLNQTSTFDPGIAGKVESITFNLDLMNIERTPKTDVYYAIVLLQDGLLYQSPPARLTSAQKWKSFVSEPLTETNFTPLMPSSPSAKPNFSSNAPTLQVAPSLPSPPLPSSTHCPSLIQFGYMVHIAGVGSYLIKSITSIGEWKVSVAHRENSSASLSATQQLKLRFESELLERQLVERSGLEICLLLGFGHSLLLLMCGMTIARAGLPKNNLRNCVRLKTKSTH